MGEFGCRTLDADLLLPCRPTASFSLSNVVMRHDVPDAAAMSEQYPHLIFSNMTSKLGQRTMNILKYLFPVPKEDSHRTITFANQDDFISFRHHVYKKKDGQNELTELGPRFDMKCKRTLNRFSRRRKVHFSFVFRFSVPDQIRYHRSIRCLRYGMAISSIYEHNEKTSISHQ